MAKINKQEVLNVRIKKLSENAIIPNYAHDGDAGMDLTAVSYNYNKEYDYWEYKTDLAIEIPTGYVGLIFPRSSNSKKDVYQVNSVGVGDSLYRGNYTIRFKYRDKENKFINAIKKLFGKEQKPPYEIGNRIGQIIILPYPHINFQVVDELTETERGEGGYGSTGK